MAIYKNQEKSFEERAKDLVSRMTLSEKTSLMLHKSKAVERLGIPSYIWWNEALHGIARAGVATMFPQAIGMAATFDDNLIFEVADVISTEGRAKYHESLKKNDRDIYKGITFWTPNINIFRDPRWGRGHETYGEDPYLTARLGIAFIRGLQGNDPKYLKSSACAKHFAAHSGPEGERHRFNAVASEKDMRETYLIAFKECVKEGKVEAVMGAYNRTNGEPCCGSNALLVKILREEWGFKGHVVSDCWAIKDFHEHHKVTNDIYESIALAVNNGCDLNCGNVYESLIDAVEKGLISEEKIDESVTRLVMTRMKLGMFDDPEKVPYSNIPYEENDSPEHNELSLKTAKKSIVMLKNKNGLLPLDRSKLKSIAVIGPNAGSREALTGNYFGTASQYITAVDGIREALTSHKATSDVRIYFSEGCHLFKDKDSHFSLPGDRLTEAVSICERADITVVCLGLDAMLEGEQGDTGNEFSSGDKPNLNLPGIQNKLLEELSKTGKPIILVLLSGSALAVNWADENIPAILQAWYPGALGGRAIASILFGDESPSGRLPITFYKTTEELPDFKDYSMTGRTYRYMANDALYPFGYGLSYTKFAYSDITLSSKKINTGENMTCSVKIKNTGSCDGDEVVQLYLRDVEASVVIPKWELKGFKRIALKKGEENTVTFTIEPRRMAIIDNEGKCILEPGKFEVYIGGSQPDKRSLELTGNEVKKADFEVTGKTIEMEY
jgi:beta-glucosidase